MMKPSTQDKTEGKLHEVQGNIKEEIGKVTRDPQLQGEGKGFAAGYLAVHTGLRTRVAFGNFENCLTGSGRGGLRTQRPLATSNLLCQRIEPRMRGCGTPGIAV